MSVDQRFYRLRTTIGLRQIADQYSLNASNYLDLDIAGISSFEDARDFELCYLENKAKSSQESAKPSKKLCFVAEDSQALQSKGSAYLLPVKRPKEAFFKIAAHMFAPLQSDEPLGEPRIHPSARIGAGSVISKGVVIGENSFIAPNAYIGPGVQIGRECHIGPDVSAGFALIGNGVRILAGARIGEAGFGLMNTSNGVDDIPHFGRVILQDRVYIGANTCIDRGLLSDTLIGEGSKIDNMSHIGHNTVVGRNVVMAAYAGISGSVRIGDGVQMGGRVGVVDHVEIGAGSHIAAGSNVLSSVPTGVIWGGIPARPLKDWQRETVWLKRQAAKGRQK